MSPRRAHVLRITAAVTVVGRRPCQRRLIAARIAEVLLGQTWVLLLEHHLWKVARIHLTLSTETGIIASVDARQINHHVSPEEQISCAIEGQLSVATEHNLCVERLLNRLHSEVGVSVVTKAPEGDRGVLTQILVGRTESDQLRQRTALRGTNC